MNVEEAVSALSKLNNSLKSLKNTLDSTLNNAKNNSLKKDLEETTTKASDLKKALGLGVIAIGLKKTFDITKQLSNSYISMIETNNLFEVSLGRVVDKYGNLDEEASKYYTKAINFQNEMNEKLATNKSELMQYQAMYYSMFKSQGINKDASYLMSESLTKAGYDIASLYNLETTQAVEKIRAGIAGQVEPLRAIGIDISESALTRVLNDVGIDRTVQQLSYAEKEVARYIAIVNQAGQAQGDFARTFEQPANQLRVFKNQLQELSQVAGAFIVNTFGWIITWANAIIMAIKEILKAIASLFGWNLNVSGSVAEVSDSIGDINTGLGGATKKAKEFKKQLMGFDEINNITLPTNSAKGGSGGTATGIDSKLLNSLKEWDNMMDKISGKAQKIRDKILEWLGFTRDFNGNLQWAWKDMNGIAKVITVIAGLIAGIFAIGKIAKFVSWIKTLINILKTGAGATTTFGLGLQVLSKFFTRIKEFAIALKLLVTNGNGGILMLKELASTAGFVTGVITILIARFVELYIKSENFRKGLEIVISNFKWFIEFIGDAVIGVFKTIGNIFSSLGNALIEFCSQFEVFKALQPIIEKLDLDFSDLILTIGGLLLCFVNPALGGAVLAFEGISLAIRAIGADSDESVSKLNDLAKANEKLKSRIEKTTEAYESQKQSIKENAETKMADMEYTETLKNKLKALVDENGRVKKGYEARVDFILGELNSALDTQYKAENGIIENYKNMQTEIENLIVKKKKEIEQEAYLELYRESIKKQIQDTKDLKEAEENYNKAVQSVTDSEEKGFIQRWKSNKELEKAGENLSTISEKANQTSRDVIYYGQQVDLYAQETTQAVGEISTSITEEVAKSIEEMKILAETNTQEYISKLNEMDEATKANMLSQTTTISTLSPEIQEEWNKLATGSRDNFLSAISQVPIDTESSIIASITKTQGLTENVASAWQNLATRSKEEFEKQMAEIEPDTQGAILASIAQAEGLTENTRQAWFNLAQTDNQAYNTALSSIDTDTATKIQNAVNEVNNKQNSANQAGSNVGGKVKSGFDGGLGDTGASARYFVQGFINVISGNPLGIFQIVGGFANAIVSHFDKGLGNASPSKKTKKSARFFAQGFQLQLNKAIPETVKQVTSFANDLSDSFNDNLSINSQLGELNKGVSINTKDFEVDTNNFIDYGKVNGNIATVSQIEINGNIIEDMTANIVNAINDRTIDVNITAKTDKGTILETAVDGIKDYTNRTGNLPFPILV